MLKKLVEFHTVSTDRQGIEKCFRFLQNYLSSYQLDTRWLESNGHPSIFATTQPGSRRPKLILQAHIDVVPGQDEHFKLAERDGKLLGRGTFDMKFAAACYLQLVEDLKDELGMYDFGLMLTSDEEIGGENGVGYLLQQGYGAEVCLLPDGGDHWEIEASCNGVWMIRLKAHGAAAHGSRPWEGENAIGKLVEALDEIKGLFGDLAIGRSTITISQIHGGEAINQVPDYAEATLDMRFIKQEEMQSYRQAVELIVANRGLECVTEAESDCGMIDMGNPHVIDFMMVAERVVGHSIKKNHSLGASDARFFAAKDIPVIITRPRGGGHHGSDEWIDRQEFLKFYELLREYVKETAKKA